MRVAVPLVLVALGACARPGVGGDAVSGREERVAATSAGPRERTPRYVVASSSLVERDGKVSRVIAGGRRLELVSGEIGAIGASEPSLDRGARFPSWSPGKKASYLFWSPVELFAADGFLASPRLVAPFTESPRDAAAWLTGLAVVLAGGARVYDADGIARPLGVPAVVRAVAASATFGAAETVLGHTYVTLDGGAHFTDATATLGGGATSLEARDGNIVSSSARGDRALGPDGKPASVSPRTPTRGDAEPEDPFFAATGEAPLDAAIRSGMPLEDGAMLITSGKLLARFDPDAMRTTSLVALPTEDGALCEPVRSGREVLLVCVSPERASVIGITGAPRVERTFDLVGASELDRFVAGGEDALGFLGACDGSPVHVLDVDGAGDPSNVSPQRAPVFCVRRGAEDWVERRVTGREANDVIAWIPRPGGDAIALLARTASDLADAEPVSVRGGLRVVSLPLSRPPLMTVTAFERKEVVARSLRATPDGAIEGWLPANVFSGAALAPQRIEPDGRGRAFSPPVRLASVEHAGRFALGATTDGQLFETLDAGRSWAAVRTPPVGATAPLVVGACSLAGCSLGAFHRLGWGRSPPDLAPRPSAPPPSRPEARPSPPPLVMLTCTPASLPEGAREETAGLAFGPVGRTPGEPRPLGNVGLAEVPEPMLGTQPVELAWIDLLAPGAPIRRRAVPIAKLAHVPSSGWDFAVAPLLTASGAVDLVAAGRPSACAAELFEAAGIGRSLGACMPDRSLAVELAHEVLGLNVDDTSLGIWVSRAIEEGGAAGSDRRARRASLRHVGTTEIGASLDGFLLGVGERGGSPVVVAVDLAGDAVLSPIDEETGAFGREERLASLRSASLGSSAGCAPTPGDARVILATSGVVGVDPEGLPAVRSAPGQGYLVARWSARRMCVDAIEIPIGDTRFGGPEYGVDAIAVRKIVARFDHGAEAAIVHAAPREETRQRLRCTSLRAVTP